MEPEQRLVNLIDNIKNSKINSHNKHKILEFVNELKANNKASNTSIKYLYPLYQMNKRRWITKNFEDLTKQDLKEVVAKVNDGKSKTGKAWSGKTKKNFRLTIKVFYKWIEGIDEPRYYPEKVRWITTTIPKREKRELKFEDMVTREEVIRMSQCALNPMHKAFVWFCFESTGRPEENLNTMFSDIKFDTQGAIVMLRGVKDKRPCRLVSSVEPLRNWLRHHPLKDQKDYPVWVTQFSKKKNNEDKWTPIQNQGANKILRTLGARAGINNRITMYSLRKGRITELAKSDISSPLLKTIVGWTQNSTVSDKYIKFTMKDTDNAVLKTSGFISEEREKIDSYVQCKWCGTKCSPGSLYCENPKCGKPLIITDSEIDTLRKEMNELIDRRLSQASGVLDKVLRGNPKFEKAYRIELRKLQKGSAKP